MVDDKKEPEENKEEETKPAADNAGTGSESESNPLIKAANTAAERLEEANKKTEELMGQQADLFARQRLGGQTEGNAEPEKKDEETPEDYAQKALEGKIIPKED
tara:strand:+ start:2198 stop:2509 length:312 start_codon:yes stop_codon:yes gene_type:complete